MIMAIAALSAEAPTVWHKSGPHADAYEIGTDTAISHSGKASGYIRSRADVETGKFAILMQVIRADQYRGKKVRMSAYIRVSEAEEGAFLWLRIDDVETALEASNDRTVAGSADWRRYELVLPVSETVAGIAFGLGLAGAGQAWIDDVKLEAVDAATPMIGNRREHRPPPEHVERYKKYLSNHSTRSAVIVNANFEQ
jgi:hypothetical protein